MEWETIAAIATPVGSGGIGIIKISGNGALKIADAIFRPIQKINKGGNLETFFSIAQKPHKISYGHIIHPENKQIIDEVLVSFMPGPKSYTCEDIIEINTHSGSVAIKAVLGLILNLGARLAEPGEFTKRAFLNGRIDLTQSEGVMDIITAKTQKALQFAANQINGELKNTIEFSLSSLKEIFSKIEAGIDFPEEVGDIVTKEEAEGLLVSNAITPLKGLLEQYERASVLKDGIRIVIVGKPNVGKSSLLNCLIRKDRAIVSAVPGTTRDFIEEACIIHSIPLVLTDTAGLHDSVDVIENFGMEKTREIVLKADIILFVVDVSRPAEKSDLDIYQKVRNKNCILVKNKIDLAPEGWFNEDRDWGNIQVSISSLTRDGIDNLENAIANYVFNNEAFDFTDCRVVPNFRHKALIEKCISALQTAVDGLKTMMVPELLAIDIKEAIRYLEAILGIHVSTDVLDDIFSRFCIGK